MRRIENIDEATIKVGEIFRVIDSRRYGNEMREIGFYTCVKVTKNFYTLSDGYTYRLKDGYRKGTKDWHGMIHDGFYAEKITIE